VIFRPPDATPHPPSDETPAAWVFCGALTGDTETPHSLPCWRPPSQGPERNAQENDHGSKPTVEDLDAASDRTEIDATSDHLGNVGSALAVGVRWRRFGIERAVALSLGKAHAEQASGIGESLSLPLTCRQVLPLVASCGDREPRRDAMTTTASDRRLKSRTRFIRMARV
jgi:hypothetical protein